MKEPYDEYEEQQSIGMLVAVIAIVIIEMWPFISTLMNTAFSIPT